MKQDQPNILIIMSDQHHAGVMGCAGDEIIQTPNLDRLADNGVRFTSAHCPCPLCGPSRMSFMTGQYPHQIDSWDNETQLDSEVQTFAYAFGEAGYDTILSGRMHFVGADQRHGFAERLIGDVPPTAFITAGWRLDEVLGDLVDTPGCSLPGILKSGPGRTGYHAYDEAVASVTVDWLKQRGKSAKQKPFLLTVGYAAPHCPFVAPPDDFEAYRDKISKSDLPVPDENLHPRNAALRKGFGTDPEPPVDAQWRTRVAYYGLTSFLDQQVGSVLSALEQAGLAENTIIVYCSDHGEMLGEHGMWWKSTFYNGACRVPLIVSWPGQLAAGECRTQNVSLMDIGPTLLDLAGLDPLPDVCGRSFAKLLDGDDAEWDDTVFSEYSHDTICRMVRSGPWKYNYYQETEPELFNLQDDPDELTNLAGRQEVQEVERRLNELVLRDWDAEDVQSRVKRWQQQQRQSLVEWIRTTNPPEPDPPWFSEKPENWVDSDVAVDSASGIGSKR